MVPAVTYLAPVTPPGLSYEMTPESTVVPPGPPPFLSPDAVPDSPPPMIPAPAIATQTPIPAKDAGNCIQRDEQGRLLGWMDYQHCVFSGRSLATARWFDDLFGDWYDNEAAMLVRAITETTMTESDGASVNLRVRASAALPNAKKRLRVIITDDADQDSRVDGQDVLSQLQRSDNKVSAALRWIPFDRAGIQSDFDIGVRGIGPPDIFARARLRKNWNITRDFAMRAGETLRYGSDTKGRSTTQLDYEYALGTTALARLSSAYQYEQENHEDGFIVAHGLSMSHVLGTTQTLGYGFSVNGYTQPNWHSENYGPWALYRSSFLRSWLFYEVEPRVTWYRDRDWDSVLSLTLRLEVQFGRK